MEIRIKAGQYQDLFLSSESKYPALIAGVGTGKTLCLLTKVFKYCEDYEWWVRIILTGLSVRYIGQSLVSYRTHSSNMTSSIFKIQFFCIKIAQHLFMQALIQFSVAVTHQSR